MSNATAVHQNSPLTPTGRLRLVERHLRDGIPIAHVAAEFKVAWDTAKKWIDRYLAHGQEGLADRSSVPAGSPHRTEPVVVERIEALRRALKWSARRIHAHLAAGGVDPLPEDHPLAQGTVHAPVAICLRTVGRWLARLGISRLRNLTPHGQDLRQPPKVIDARAPGYMVHLDVKKLGRIPDGGGWAAHGRGTPEALAGKRGAGARVGYTYLHSAIDGYTRLAYTEALPDERAATTIGFWYRARAFFTAHS